MCRPNNTPLYYTHQALMNDLNKFMTAVKVHLQAEKIGAGLSHENLKKLQDRYPKPEIADIDAMHQRINEILKKDATPFIKY